MAGLVKALIVLSQVGFTPPAGYTSGSLDDLALGQQITAHNYDDSNVETWSWTFVPPVFQAASSYAASGANGSTFQLTPPSGTGYGDCYLRLDVAGPNVGGKANVSTDRVLLGVRAPASAYGAGVPLPHPYEGSAGGVVTFSKAFGREGRVQEALYAIFRQALTGSSGGVAVAGSGFLHATGGLLDSSASHGADGQVPLGGSTDITWGKVTSGHVDGSVVITTDVRLAPTPGVVGRMLYDTGSAWGVVTTGAANSILAGNGAGAAPAFTTTPTVSQITSGAFISSSASPATLGAVRLAQGDTIVTMVGASARQVATSDGTTIYFGDGSAAAALRGSTITLGGGSSSIVAQGSLQITPLSTGILHADASGHITSSLVTASDVNATVLVASGANPLTGDLPAGGHKITGLGTPTATGDAATKGYVDGVAAGISPKASVRMATTGPLPACTYANGTAGVGATLTANANGAAPTVDGATPALNDRILVKDEATGANLGIYTWTSLGGASSTWQLTRATDANTPAELAGAFVFVELGTVNAGSGWVLPLDSSLVIGTTALTWTQFSGAGEITAGTNLSKSGNTLSVVAAPTFSGTVTAGAFSTTGTGAFGATTVSTLTATGLVKGATGQITSLSTGVVLADASGNLASGQISDANVATSAAIAGSKINPDFVDQTVHAGIYEAGSSGVCTHQYGVSTITLSSATGTYNIATTMQRFVRVQGTQSGDVTLVPTSGVSYEGSVMEVSNELSATSGFCLYVQCGTDKVWVPPTSVMVGGGTVVFVYVNGAWRPSGGAGAFKLELIENLATVSAGAWFTVPQYWKVVSGGFRLLTNPGAASMTAGQISDQSAGDVLGGSGGFSVSAAGTDTEQRGLAIDNTANKIITRSITVTGGGTPTGAWRVLVERCS